jgi:uncharacterized protein YdeI (YjbR/CyaY-like superfamily)
MMDVRESLTLDKPEDFRRWLQENHQTKIEIWLIFYKKSSGKQTLTIAQAVEEALCFGWIQSRLKPLDPQCFAVRFSPRHMGSIWSLPNLKRVRKLIEQGRMTEAGMAVLPPDFKGKLSEFFKDSPLDGIDLSRDKSLLQ